MRGLPFRHKTGVVGGGAQKCPKSRAGGEQLGEQAYSGLRTASSLACGSSPAALGPRVFESPDPRAFAPALDGGTVPAPVQEDYFTCGER